MRDHRLVGSTEASRICGISYPTFMRWVEQGRIEPVYVLPGRGAKVFDRDEVNRLAGEIAAGLRERLAHIEAEAAS